MYLLLKNMKPAERKTVNRRVVFFAGKAAPACMSFAFPLFQILDASKSRLYRKAGLWSDYFQDLILIIYLIDHSPYN